MDIHVRRQIHGGTGCYEIVEVVDRVPPGVTSIVVEYYVLENTTRYIRWPPIVTIYDDGHITPPWTPQPTKDALRGVLETIEKLGDVSTEEKCAAVKTTFLLGNTT